MARILFLGQLFEGLTALGRVRALEERGHSVSAIESFPPESRAMGLVRATRRRLGVGPSHPVNLDLLKAVEDWSPDLIWIEKGIHVSPLTLVEVRRRRAATVLVHYTCDRTTVPSNVSPDLLKSIPLYDVAATTVRGDLEYFARLGARRVVRTWHGYDPHLFKRPPLRSLDVSLAQRVVFVGSWEAERARTIAALAGAGLPVTIVSPWREWAKVAARKGDVEWRRQAVFGKGYPILLASSGIALGFLRKLSQDQHTQRSFEIPASHGLLLAERTSEHQELFSEGTEAEFFGSDEECIEKCRVLLASPERRDATAEAGWRRCTTSGYSWAVRLDAILHEVGAR